ncbi:MAG: hypothetical protein ACRC62_13805, partial [Microcoleus sp.]
WCAESYTSKKQILLEKPLKRLLRRHSSHSRLLGKEEVTSSNLVTGLIFININIYYPNPTPQPNPL